VASVRTLAEERRCSRDTPRRVRAGHGSTAVVTSAGPTHRSWPPGASRVDVGLIRRTSRCAFDFAASLRSAGERFDCAASLDGSRRLDCAASLDGHPAGSIAPHVSTGPGRFDCAACLDGHPTGLDLRATSCANPFLDQLFSPTRTRARKQRCAH
jgi:hypothetical protein